MRASRLCRFGARANVWRAVLGAVGICLLGSGGRAADGEAPQAAEAASFEPPFEWSAPAGCPDRAQVLEALPQSLVLDRASWDHVDRVQGRISSVKPSGWELTLEFQHAQRLLRRTFVTRECTDLAQAAAASLALVLDPSWDWAPEDSPVATPTPASTPGSAEDRSSAQSPAAREGSEGQITFAVGADGVLDATTFGRGALGISVLGRANFAGLGPPLSAELFGTWLPERRIAVRTGEAVALGLLAGGARGCWSAQATLALCAELELGQLSATGVGLEGGRRARDLWVAPGPSVALSALPLAGVRLSARVGLLVPLVRPRYFVDQTESVHDVPGYAVRVSLGATLPVF